MRKPLAILLCILFVLYCADAVSAHPGRTDSNGGHTDHDTGEYHYHHGYPEHDHYDMNGDGISDCPYDFDDKTGENSGESPGNSSAIGKGGADQKADDMSPQETFDWNTLFTDIIPRTLVGFAMLLMMAASILSFLGKEFAVTLMSIGFALFAITGVYMLAGLLIFLVVDIFA